MSISAMDRIAAIQQQLAAISGVQTPPSPSAATAAPAGSSFSDALAAAQQPSSLGAAASPAASATPFGAEIDAAAQRNGIDPALLTGLVRQESGFDPAARSSAGALGLTQLMPATAASLGVTNPTDPVQAIEGGAKYLAEQLQTFGGDAGKALAAYNAGPGAVKRYGGVPPYGETQTYVQRVLQYAHEAGMAA